MQQSGACNLAKYNKMCFGQAQVEEQSASYSKAKQAGGVAPAQDMTVLQAADTVKQQASQLTSSKVQLREAAAAQQQAAEVSHSPTPCLCMSVVCAYITLAVDAWY